MKYHYFYQSSKNESLDGWINAKDRNDAYMQLRKQGIKPYKLLGKDPVAWKRWAAIVVLAFLVAGLAAWILLDQKAGATNIEERSQLYGDPAIIQQLSADGWRKEFPEGDAWFARHAIPASMCDCKNAGRDVQLDIKPVAIVDADLPELAKMKRMVNCMKQELREFLEAGETVEDYMLLCDERLETERGLVESYRRDFDLLIKKGGDIEDAWEKKNAELRSIGLPTLPMPQDETLSN